MWWKIFLGCSLSIHLSVCLSVHIFALEVSLNPHDFMKENNYCPDAFFVSVTTAWFCSFWMVQKKNQGKVFFILDRISPSARELIPAVTSKEFQISKVNSLDPPTLGYYLFAAFFSEDRGWDLRSSSFLHNTIWLWKRFWNMKFKLTFSNFLIYSPIIYKYLSCNVLLPNEFTFSNPVMKQDQSGHNLKAYIFY